MLLSEIATAGKNGQFRTPRHIIKLMAELVAPQLGQRMADPSSGTGGFILDTFNTYSPIWCEKPNLNCW
jgi:type I restriction enzyme M protein